MNSHPGTYALILRATHKQDVQIGRLGHLSVRLGFYVYIGSAFGPGGVLARVRHHTQITQRPHWHIDSLRQAAQLKQVWYTHDPVHREHAWAEVFANMLRASIPLPGFGASDCTCVSHLYFLQRQPSLENFRRRIQTGFSSHDPIENTIAEDTRGNAPLVVHSRYDL